jgi:hypothetical protein
MSGFDYREFSCRVSKKVDSFTTTLTTVKSPKITEKMQQLVAHQLNLLSHYYRRHHQR